MLDCGVLKEKGGADNLPQCVVDGVVVPSGDTVFGILVELREIFHLPSQLKRISVRLYHKH